MDSVREEVRALLVRASNMGWNSAKGHEPKPDKLTESLNPLTDAIMSALKRASGVVVKELEWEKTGVAMWSAQTPFGKYHIVQNRDDQFAAFGPDNWALTPEATLEAAKAACQADLAKRIASAVEPSCVVTDDLREQFHAVIMQALHDCGAVSSRAEQDRIAYEAADIILAKPALTAALSSHTEEEPEHLEVGPPPSPEEAARCRQKALEFDKRAARLLVEEEVRADERERLAKLAGNLNIYNGHDSLGRPAMISVAGWLRSLTNGGE